MRHTKFRNFTDLVGLWPLNCQNFGADVAGVANLNLNYDRTLPHAPAFRCSSQYHDVSGALDMTAQLGEEKFIEVIERPKELQTSFNIHPYISYSL